MKRAKDIVNRPAATALLTLMHDISEDCWCAGWMSSLEFTLWDVVQGGDRNVGMFPLSEERVECLRWLAEQAGGWWIWDNGEKFIPTAEWLPMYEANRHKRDHAR